MLKKCRKCDTEKELSEFNNSSSAKDGKQTKCRECEHQYRKDHIERYLQKGKEYRENNKEARETNINYRLRMRLSVRIRNALLNNDKSARTMELLGCRY